MSVYEPNSRHLQEILIFCFNMKKSAAEAHRMLSNTYGEERVVSGFNASRTVILTSKKERFSKMQNWRHYLSKIRVKIKKNWHDHWEWLNKPFQNASKPWEWFRSKEIECRTNWSREMLNGVCLLVNSCLKGKDGRDFCIALWLGTKNGFITIIPSAENHGEFPAMLPRRRPNRIFTAPRSCSVFGGTSVVYYELLKPTETITGDRYRTQLMRLSRALKDKDGRNTTRDTIKSRIRTRRRWLIYGKNCEMSN